MEFGEHHMEYALNAQGCYEFMKNNFIKSRLDKVVEIKKIKSEDEYFNFLISLSEYSFSAFSKDAANINIHKSHDTSKSDGSFNNTFYYDYANKIDYNFIYSHLKNPLIRKPEYDQYCKLHKDTQEGMCFDCLERYRVITRNLIPLMKTLRKDLCSIYFTDMLYDLIRFENRNLYAFITYMINNFSDGSSFKKFVTTFGKKKIKKLLKSINKPFRRIDFKMILKKYVPLLYSTFAYCANTRTDCLDKVYDYMLSKGLSMFKNVPSNHVVVGYKVGNNYRIDILNTSDVINFTGEHGFQIGSHTLLEGLNFGFYDDRMDAYNSVNQMNGAIKKGLREKLTGFTFSGQSVFTGRTINSSNVVVIGFIKESENTFQNFRLDIHIESIIPNHDEVDALRKIKHDKWSFEDNEYDV